MKWLIPILVVIIPLAAWQFSKNRSTIKTLQGSIEADQVLVREHLAKQQEIEAKPVQRPDAAKIEELKQAYRALLKLRGEHTQLSQGKEMSMEELEAEIARSQSRAQTLQAEAQMIEDMDAFKRQRVRDRGKIAQLIYVINFYAKKHGELPGSIKEAIEDALNNPSEEMERVIALQFEEMDDSSSISWKDCELFLTDIREENGNKMIFVREREPVAAPDQQLSRVYVGRWGTKLIMASPEQFHSIESQFISNFPKSLQD